MKSKESSSTTKTKEPQLSVPATHTQGQSPRQPPEPAQEQPYGNQVNDKNGNSNTTLARPRPHRTSPSVLRPRPNSGNGPDQQKVLVALKAKGITALELADQGDVQAPALLEWLYSAAATPQWVSDLVKNVLGVEVTAAATGLTTVEDASGEEQPSYSPTNPRQVTRPQPPRSYPSSTNAKNNSQQPSLPNLPKASASAANANAIRAARANRAVSGSDGNTYSSAVVTPSSTSSIPSSRKPASPQPQLQTKPNGGGSRSQSRPQPSSQSKSVGSSPFPKLPIQDVESVSQTAPSSDEKLTTQVRGIGEEKGEEKQVPPVLPITPGQIEMLDALLLKIGWGRAALERKTAKPMEQLTRNEARRWLAWLNEETKGKVSAARSRTVSKP